jgi:predicted Zn finger-like uncharacterized protein
MIPPGYLGGAPPSIRQYSSCSPPRQSAQSNPTKSPVHPLRGSIVAALGFCYPIPAGAGKVPRLQLQSMDADPCAANRVGGPRKSPSLGDARVKIAVACPHCQKQYQIASELAGKRVKCAQCATLFAVPRLAAATPSTAATTPTRPTPAEPSRPSSNPVARTGTSATQPTGARPAAPGPTTKPSATPAAPAKPTPKQAGRASAASPAAEIQAPQAPGPSLHVGQLRNKRIAIVAAIVIFAAFVCARVAYNVFFLEPVRLRPDAVQTNPGAAAPKAR